MLSRQQSREGKRKIKKKKNQIKGWGYRRQVKVRYIEKEEERRIKDFKPHAENPVVLCALFL